ncbi:MAG: carbamoyltransferase [Deltaproteobacteria bacterium]|nr:carbamoyltransferase [Deltaproteobacteria bacterium]
MPTYVLGISAYYHDSAACLLEDGRVVAAAQEERFTRKRHDAAYPEHAIRYCLAEAGITPERLDLICFYDKPVRKLARILESHLTVAPRGFFAFAKALPVWLKQKLWIARDLERRLPGDAEVIFTEHHQAHAASAFYPSPFDRAAVLTIDGVGELATTSAGVGDGASLELHRELHFPHSLGLLYSAFTYLAGFKVNSGEYKLMGLAPYGRPVYRERILRELVDLKEDGTFRLAMEHFAFLEGERMIRPSFERLFDGPARAPDAPITQRDLDVAASCQAVTEEIVLALCRDLHRRTGLEDLCLAGGVALNCVANGKIVRSGTGFRRIWVQPAAGDAGGAVGAAFAAWHGYLGQPRPSPGSRDAMHGARLGPRFDDAAIDEVLASFGARAERLPDDALLPRVARLLAEGHVVGWFQGRMEFGPRALGARSILGDPRRRDMQRTMNRKIKMRESFRPFAPSVLEEDAARYFDLDGDSPYMLVTAPVRPEHLLECSADDAQRSGLDRLDVARSKLPAITHVDGSARVQTVSRRDDPRYHALLEAFRAETGCSVLVNTSFNVRGEPIVCTPREAYVCFLSTSIDYLVLEDRLLDRRDQPELPASARPRFEPD